MPFILVCPSHGVKLRENCPACKKPLYQRTKLKDFQSQWLLFCPHCQYLLADRTIQENQVLAQIQALIHRILLTEPSWSTHLGYKVFWHSYRITRRLSEESHLGYHLQWMVKILKTPIKKVKACICPFCGKFDFETHQTYESHVWACSRQLECPFCERQDFTSKVSFSGHVSDCSNKHYGWRKKCPYCGDTYFPTESSYAEHLLECVRTLICPKCEETNYFLKSSYVKHVWLCRDTPECPKCHETEFANRFAYTTHICTCVDQPECPYCGGNDFPNVSFHDHYINCRPIHYKKK